MALLKRHTLDDRLISNGVVVMGIGLAVLGLTSAVSSRLRNLLLLGGLILVALAVLMFLLAIGLRLFGAKEWFDDAFNLVLSRTPALTPVWLTESDLPRVYNLASELLPRGHPERDMVEKRLVKNRKIIRGVCKGNTADGELLGYFIIYPLGKRATKQLMDGTIVQGHQILPDLIYSEWRAPESIYIAALAARTIAGRAATLAALKDIVFTYKRPPVLFARPVSQDGLRLLKSHHFHPIKDPNNAWVFDPRAQNATGDNLGNQPA
jgi:hypothetical protein